MEIKTSTGFRYTQSRSVAPSYFQLGLFFISAVSTQSVESRYRINHVCLTPKGNVFVPEQLFQNLYELGISDFLKAYILSIDVKYCNFSINIIGRCFCLWCLHDANTEPDRLITNDHWNERSYIPLMLHLSCILIYSFINRSYTLSINLE